MLKNILVAVSCAALLFSLPEASCALQPSGKSDPDWPELINRLRQQLNSSRPQPRIRRSLAVAYNNYAVHLADEGRFQDAIAQLKEAKRLDSNDAKLDANLASIYIRMAQKAIEDKRPRSAKSALRRALELSPDNANAYILLGEINYNSQRLKEARSSWEHALRINPGLADVSERLRRLERELPVEAGFGRISQFYFDIRYTEQLERPTGFDVRDLLLQARRAIGSDFAYWPKHKIIVLLYSDAQFRQLRRSAPDWVAAQYDGKIRLPLPSRRFDNNQVRRILYHEYTHAVVGDLTNNKCPIWFNEGLAEYEAWKGTRPPWMSLRQRLALSAAWQGIPWAGLSGHIQSGVSAQGVALAYQEAHSIVAYLAKRYGFWRIRRILRDIRGGSSLHEAMRSEYHIPYERLQRRWRKWLSRQLAGHA